MSKFHSASRSWSTFVSTWLVIFSTIFSLIVPSISWANEDYWPQPKKLDTTGFREIFAQIGADIYIAGQPAPEGLQRVKELGVTRIINLRTTMEMDNREVVPFDEAQAVKDLGIEYVHIPLGGPDTPYSLAGLDQFAQAMSEAQGPVLLHCTVAWRATHMWTAYLIKHKKVPFAEAVVIGRELNLGRLPLEGFLDQPLTFAPANK